MCVESFMNLIILINKSLTNEITLNHGGGLLCDLH